MPFYVWMIFGIVGTYDGFHMLAGHIFGYSILASRQGLPIYPTNCQQSVVRDFTCQF
jgi:hypothetical protein